MFQIPYFLFFLAFLVLSFGAEAAVIGAYSAAKSTFYLMKTGQNGAAPVSVNVQGVKDTWLPVLGAGTYQFGLYDPQTGTFHFRLEGYSGPVTRSVQFAGFKSSWLPVAGDWDGDLAYGVGLYDPQTGTFYLKNELTSGPADMTVRLSNTQTNWRPIVGDWDGDGVTTVGAYNPGNGQFFLRNINTNGPAELTMQIQGLSTSLRPVAADWNNDGRWSPGLYNSALQTFYWRNALNSGPKQGQAKVAGADAAAVPVTRSISVTEPTPAVTDTGIAIGAAAKATIGPAGGTLRSSDNGLLLTIPAGALDADTEITIQPIANHAHGGIGMAYRLLPDGQTFKQPVKLTFSYAGKNVKGSVAKFLGGAFQTPDGYWSWVDKPVVNTVAKTVTISTTHFTDFAQVESLTLSPTKKSIMVNETVALRVINCYPDVLLAPLTKTFGMDCTEQSEDLLAPLVLPPQPVWAVNGVAGGTAEFGTVSGDHTGATYVAPAIKPIPQTVAVSAKFDFGSKGVWILVSNIEIRDTNAYKGYVNFQNGEISGQANLTWTEDENLGDVRGYRATGSITAHFNLQNCDPAIAITPIGSRSALKVFTGINNAYPNRYMFGVTANSEDIVTVLTCHTDQGNTYPLPIFGFQVGFIAADCFSNPNSGPKLKYTDDANLSGKIDCSSASTVYKADWSFKGFLKK